MLTLYWDPFRRSTVQGQRWERASLHMVCRCIQACMQTSMCILSLGWNARRRISEIRPSNLNLIWTSCPSAATTTSSPFPPHLRPKLLKLQITRPRGSSTGGWWQADGSRARRDPNPPPPPPPSHIKRHLHFMSLNCVCCPPPHRLGDFGPVTAHPCTLKGAVID